MTDKEKLNKINKEIKVLINQSSFISIKIRNKVIKMLGDEFSIKLPVEDFKNIDVHISLDGNITMRGVEYKREEKLDIDSICTLFESFKEKADKIIDKNEVDYYKNYNKNNIKSILILLFLVIIFIILINELISSFITKNFYNMFWDLVILSTYLTPGISKRFIDAIDYIRRKTRRRK